MKRRKVQEQKGIEGLRIRGFGEGQTGERLIGRTKPFARNAKATKGKGHVLRNLADGYSRACVNRPSQCESSRPAMTVCATVTIKVAYADGLRLARHSQATWCSSPFSNLLLECFRSKRSGLRLAGRRPTGTSAATSLVSRYMSNETALADCRWSFRCAARAGVTAWSQVRKPDRQVLDGASFARTIVLLYARGRSAGR